MMMPKKKQRGVAIITVLLVIAVVSVLAVKMSGQLRYQLAYTSAHESSEQAYWHWLSAEALARQVLVGMQEQSDGKTQLNQDWAQPQGPFPVRGGMIAGQLKDLQACFNINSLALVEGESAAREDGKERFKALLESLEVDTYTAERLTATLVDWLDEDSMLHESMGAEDPDYESLPQPYQAANALMSHISELRQVIGFNQTLYQLLKPYVCVIPGVREWRLNINTIDPEQPEILAAYFKGDIDVSTAEQILGNRGEQGYDTVDELRQESALQSVVQQAGQSDIFENIAVTSEYFELHAQVQYGDLELYGTSIIHVSQGASFVLHRSRGGYLENE